VFKHLNLNTREREDLISFTLLNASASPIIEALNEEIIKQGETGERKCMDEQLKMQMLRIKIKPKDTL
jgi:hypothetical protein